MAVFATAFGQFLLAVVPLVGPLADLVAQLASALAPLLPLVGQVAPLLGGVLVKALGIVVQAITPILPLLSQTVVLFGVQLMQALDLSPVLQFGGTFSTPMPAVAPILPLLAQFSAPILPLAVQLAAVLAPVLIQLASGFIQIFQAVMPLLPPLLQLATGIGRWIVGTLVAFFADLPGGIMRAVGDIGSLMSGIGQAIRTGVWTGVVSMYDCMSAPVPAFLGPMRGMTSIRTKSPVSGWPQPTI